MEKGYLVSAFGTTDVGQRKNNEDAFLINEALGLFIVADGMGGHDQGEVASWYTSEALERIISIAKGDCGHSTLDDGTPVAAELLSDDELIQYAVMVINRRLFEKNEEICKLNPVSDGSAESIFTSLVSKKRRMGTTLVSLLVRGKRAYVAHVGDSRAYRIGGGKISLLTTDHSLVAEMVRSGALSPEEAVNHEKKNVITRSVGFKPDVKTDIDALTIYPPERFLLCSDGLSGVLTEEEIFSLSSRQGLREACLALIELAKKKGGRDNITCVLVEISDKNLHAPHENTDV